MDGVDTKESADIDQAELDAYMDAENAERAGEGLSDTDRLNYYMVRYEQVKAEYKGLLLQQEELVRSDRKEQLPQLSVAFKANYKARKTAVLELRNLGQHIIDRAVPG